MKTRPYLYPLITGSVPATGVSKTVNATAVVLIPTNSKFIWTNTINCTFQTSSGGFLIEVMMFDSVNGPIFNEPLDIRHIAGDIYQTFSLASRTYRPFPLPECYIFERGASITATYSVK